jgi:hypothetical protein
VLHAGRGGGVDETALLLGARREGIGRDEEHAIDALQPIGQRLGPVEVDDAGLGALRDEISHLGRVAGAGDHLAGALFEEDLDHAAAEVAGGAGDEEDGVSHGLDPAAGYE